MKKLIPIIMIFFVVFSLYGCSKTKEEPTESETNIVVQEQAEEETLPKTSEAIPDPEEIFSDDAHVAILVYNKPQTYYQIKDYKDGEYEAYIDACEEFGFTDIQYKGGVDGNDMFLAYDENHEYYLDIGISPDAGIIHITVDLVEE